MDYVRVPTVAEIEKYWNERIHDLKMTSHPIGTIEFFDDLDHYRFEKLHYLLRLVDFDSFRGRHVLEIGCGIGTDLVRFAFGGARITGVDLSETAIKLARTNVRLHTVSTDVDLRVSNGEDLPFADESFDVVYAHGVVQYTADASRLVAECHRVLRSEGQAIFMVYNRFSWLNALSKVMKVELEHEDAPVLKKYSKSEFRALLSAFNKVTIIPERFPVKSRLHSGWKAWFYNTLFVGAFNSVPRLLIRRIGWHLMAFCMK